VIWFSIPFVLHYAVSKQIVDQHGGSLNVHSSGEGEGSTFTLRLPLSNKEKGPERDVIAPTSDTLNEYDDENEPAEVYILCYIILLMMFTHHYELKLQEINVPNFSSFRDSLNASEHEQMYGGNPSPSLKNRIIVNEKSDDEATSNADRKKLKILVV